IERIAKAEAEAGGAEKMPLVEHFESTSALYNDPVLARYLVPVLEATFGKSNVVTVPAVMASEDYSFFVEQGVPSFFFSLGAADPEKLRQARAAGHQLPSNHSSLFAPDADPSLHTGIAAEVAVLRDLLRGSPADVSKITEHKEGGN